MWDQSEVMCLRIASVLNNLIANGTKRDQIFVFPVAMKKDHVTIVWFKEKR